MATDGRQNGRRTYTEQQREEALRLYVELGPAETARQMDIPRATISKWAERAGVTGDRKTKQTAAIAAMEKTLAQRRVQLAKDLMSDVELLRTQLFEPATVHKFDAEGGFHLGELAEPTFRDKVSLMTAIAIAVDKIQLLSGAPTSRSENVEITELDREIAKLLGQMDGQPSGKPA
jgi:transposase-like protein